MFSTALPDATIVPYVVRHLSDRIDKSKEVARNERLTIYEIKQILNYFNHEPCIQAYIALALESLGRPQEILYRRVKDVIIMKGYAEVWVTDHGKEGPGLLQ